jgi:hypothetical protein
MQSSQSSEHEEYLSWDVTPYRELEVADVSEGPIASVFRLVQFIRLFNDAGSNTDYSVE